MEYISKELMKVLIEKGYDYPSHKTLYYTYFPLGFNEEMPDLASWHQVIDWIFKFQTKTILSIDFDEDHTPVELTLKEQVEHLEFWYDTLIPELIEHIKYYPQNPDDLVEIDLLPQYKVINEFVLEGFIGMLLNWFRTLNIIIKIEYYGGKNHFFEYEIDEISNTMEECLYVPLVVTMDGFKTYYEARHASIKQTFKLLIG